MEEQKHIIKANISKRIQAFYTGFTVVAIIFFVAMCFIGFSPSVKKGFNDVYSNHIIDTVVVRASRGTIYSRDKQPLATSITRKSLQIDFGSERFDNYERYRKNADTLARKLALFFGDRSAHEYYSELIKWRKIAGKKHKTRKDTVEKKARFWERGKQDTTYVQEVITDRAHPTVQIFRAVDIAEWNEIRRYPLLRNGYGVTYTTIDHDYRVYPQGNIALRTIGRNNRELNLQYGIEYALRDTLAGHSGIQVMQTIAPGYKTRVASKANVEAQNGYDVVTTIDVDVQDVADNTLRSQLIKENATWGTVIVMECATGDILAMANLKRNGSICVEEQNYAIGVPINPGSTFKLVSTVALLEEGKPTSLKYDSESGRRVLVGGKRGATVQDSHRILKDDSPVLDMRTAFAESANVYFTKAIYDAFEQNPAGFSDYCHKFHLHETIGLEYLGARRGVVPHLGKKHPSRWNALVNMAYGYNLDITPMHTLAMYNAIANGGRMVAPRLILRTERNGKRVEEAPVRVIEERVCKKSTIDTLRSFMEEVSLKGTAAAYFGEKNCSFRTGLKTGTAQVNTTINGVKYNKDDRYYLGSMVTYLPADNPRYTILTAIFTKRQTGKAYYGATLVGPVQKVVATFLHNRDKEYAEEVSEGNHYSNSIKGGNIDKIRKVGGEYANDIEKESRHGWGSSRATDNGGIAISDIEVQEGVVPDVRGMGLDDALYLLEYCGLKVEVSGYGKVVRQSLTAGSKVSETNKTIKIELKQ